MVRTKQTTSSNVQAQTRQGDIARFEPRDLAIAPNAYPCGTCDRCFSNMGNLRRHEKQTHGQALYKYPCPASPQRVYSRRSDLREHFRMQHPEADVEEVDDVDVIEVPREVTSAKRSLGTEEEDEVTETGVLSETVDPKKKRSKQKTQDSKAGCSSDTNGSIGLGPIPVSHLQAIAPASKLTLIKETIKIEREYKFM